MSKLCINCGSINNDDSKKCRSCGSELPKTETNKDSKSEKNNTKGLANQYQSDSFYNQESVNVNKDDKLENSLLFDPSNKVWLNLLLLISFIIEMLMLLGVVFFFFIVLFTEEYKFYMFLIMLFGLVFFHLSMMIMLNKSFNIQSIKDDVKEILLYQKSNVLEDRKEE